jgi:predicted nucleic acid-binding protein
VKVGLDTSVVLRLLVGQPAGQTARAVAFLDELSRRGDEPVVSDLVAAEVYFALQHHYGISKKNALSGMQRLCAGDEINPQGTVAEVVEISGIASAEPGFVDRLILCAYLNEADGMATFEKSARKPVSVRVL